MSDSMQKANSTNATDSTTVSMQCDMDDDNNKDNNKDNNNDNNKDNNNDNNKDTKKQKHSHKETGYALSHPKATFDTRITEEQDQYPPNKYGPRSERRHIPIEEGEDQEGAVASVIRMETNKVAMSLLTIAMQNPGRFPAWVSENCGAGQWQVQLYGALTNTMWVDLRDPHCGEYGLSFREAAALVAFLDSITGGKQGQTYMHYHLSSKEGTAESPENHMGAYIKSLGFKPCDYPNHPRRCPRGSVSCTYECFVTAGKCHARAPMFGLLPKVMQDAIRLYCDGTEGLAALVMKVGPPKRWRASSPSPFKPDEHEAYNLMVKRDRDGYEWEGDSGKRPRPRPSSALA